MDISQEDIDSADAFFQRGMHWDYLWVRVKGELAASGPVKRAVGAALGYILPLDDGATRSGYGPFAPLFEFDGEVPAPPFDTVEPEMADIWASLADACSSPAAVARFNDLCWCIPSKPRPHQRAGMAIDAYMELAAGKWPDPGDETEDGSGRRSWTTYRRAICLARALQIATEMRKAGAVREVAATTVAAIEETLSGDTAAGALLVLFRALTSVSPRERPASLMGLLDQACGRYRDSVYTYQQLGDLKAELSTDPQAKRAVREEQLQQWLSHARSQEGIGRIAELQKALEFARTHGLGERLDELRAELDGIDKDAIEWKSISVSVDMDAAEVDSYLNSFVDAAGWRESLSAFGRAEGRPPSGDFESNQQLVEELRRQTPLQFILPTVIIDNAGRPIRHVVSDEDHAQDALVQHESLGISLWGIVGSRDHLSDTCGAWHAFRRRN